MRLYYCKFSVTYLKNVYYHGWPHPEEKLGLQRSKAYDMLEPNERVEFFDIMVALIRKVLAGQVRTVCLDKDLAVGTQSQVIIISNDANFEVDNCI